MTSAQGTPLSAAEFCEQLTRFLGAVSGDLQSWAEVAAVPAAIAQSGDREWLYDSIAGVHHERLSNLLAVAPAGLDVDQYVSRLALSMLTVVRKWVPDADRHAPSRRARAFGSPSKGRNAGLRRHRVRTSRYKRD